MWFQGLDNLTDIFGAAPIYYVEIFGESRGAVGSCSDASNDDELDMSVSQGAN
jgi:hypothetical protein